jgi:transcriptional regulator with XRE-family HTH domain
MYYTAEYLADRVTFDINIRTTYIMRMNPLKTIRIKLGMTQVELADALGVTQAQISKYERGAPEIPPQHARRLITLAQTKGKRFTFNDIYHQ